MKSTVVILILLVTQMLLAYNVHRVGKDFYNNRIISKKTTPKIYDIGYKYIPDLSTNKFLTLVIDTLPILLQVVFILSGSTFMVRFTKLNMILFISKAIMNNLTILPKIKKCNDQEYTLYNVFFGHCYDKIFSGHFATMCLFFLVAHNDNQVFANVMSSSIILSLYAIGILALRYHYTIDIIIGGLVSLVLSNTKLS